jgi:hypothetical protein
MATDLKPQAKPAPGAKHEQFVEQQLDRARRRICNLDTLTAVLLLTSGVLLYALLMAGLDRAFGLPDFLRSAAFVIAAAAAAFYAGLIVFRRVQWHVNPYYAARRLEQTIPDAKNSLINWLDLRGEAMPPVIRGTLSRKAAKDLTAADLENAVSARRPAWLAAVTGGLLLVLLVWYLMAPGQVESLLQRALFPFKKAGIASRTEIAILTPRGGNAEVPVRQDVQIRVQVSGRVPRVNQPDSLKLHYRYRRSDPYIVRPLDEDADGEWIKTLVADEVQDGFFYKVTGGDVETPVFEVKVRAQPHVTRFEAKFHYRPYLCREDVEARYGPSERLLRPDFKDLRGTEVTLVARTNRAWQSGQLVLHEGPVVKKLTGEPVEGDAQARAFKFVLDRDGSFHVQFTSAEGETNIDRGTYSIKVIEDYKPLVKITKPGHVKLPTNGTLAVEGWARDDYGLTGMTLRLRVKKGPQTPELEAKPYRPGVSFKLTDGSYPTDLAYKDLVALDKLKTAKGQPFPLSAGMVLEYWLEAVDNCDYPEPTGNVGKSEPPFLVTIVEPDKDQKRQQQLRKKAEQDRAQHDKQQDKRQQERNKQAEDRQKAAQQDPAAREKEEQKQREDFEKEAERVSQELERDKQEQEKKGSAKGDSSSESKGDGKEKGPDKSGAGAGDKKDDKNPPKEGDAAKSKGGGDDKKGADKGDGKGPGDPNKQGSSPQQPGAEKDNPTPQAGAPGQAKDQKGPGKEQSPSQAKGDGPKQPDQQAGAGKEGGGGKEQKADAGKGKDDGKGGTGGGGGQAGSKQPGAPEGMQPQAAQAKGDGKEGSGPPQLARTAPKTGPQDQAAQGKGAGGEKGSAQASQTKGDGQKAQPNPPQQAQGGAKGQPAPQARGQDKGPGSSDQGGGAQQAASAKGADPKGKQGTGAGQKKGAPPEQTQTAGQGKGERGTDDARAEQPPRREEATMDDIARLKERLERPEQQEDALDELAGVRKQARDEQVRKAAEELLKTLGRDVLDDEPAEAKGANDTPEKIAKARPKAGSDGHKKQGPQPEKGQAKGKAPQQGETAGKGKDGGETRGKQADDKGHAKKGGRQPRGDRVGKGTSGAETNPKADPVDEAAARRAGELQLEKLRDRLKKNPNLWKKLWPKEEDVDRFIERARAYQKWLREQEKLAGDEKRPATAGKNVLPGFGPTRVGARPNRTRDPLELGVAQPPPEFREAQRLFTSKTPR